MDLLFYTRCVVVFAIISLFIIKTNATVVSVGFSGTTNWHTASSNCPSGYSILTGDPILISLADLTECRQHYLAQPNTNNNHRGWLDETSSGSNTAHAIRAGAQNTDTWTYNKGKTSRMRFICCTSGNATPQPTTPTQSPTPSPTPAPVVTPPPTLRPTPVPVVAPPVTNSCGQTFTGSIVAGGHSDITITLDSTYTDLLFVGCQSNFNLALYFFDQNDNEVVYSHNYFFGNNNGCGHNNANDLLVESGIANDCSPITPGTYRFRVEGRSGASGSYSISLSCTSPPSNYDVPAAPSVVSRTRKSFLDMTAAEQQRYCDAFTELQANNAWTRLSQLHNNDGVHNHDSFLPWHRHYIWLVEEMIRDLGTVNGVDYSDFAMPYWNWAQENQPNEGGLSIANTCLGAWLGSSTCLSTVYPMYSGFTGGYGSCLRRNTYSMTSSCYFYTELQLMDLTAYSTYASFRSTFEGAPHARPHICAGQQMATFFSPDDPLFYLHHTFVDYIWALWQTCNGWQHTTMTSNSHYSSAHDQCLYYNDFTPRVPVRHTFDMYSTYGVSYEEGDFFNEASVHSDVDCGDTSNWFTAITRRRARRRLVEQAASVSAKDLRKQKSLLLLKNVRAQIEANPKYSNVTQRDINRVVLDTWREQDCLVNEVVNSRRCEPPAIGYEDCVGMTRHPYTGDIQMSMREMMSKRGNTRCMMQTIVQFYDYAWRNHRLKYLCAGCYDPFCDTSVVDGKCDDSSIYPDLELSAGRRDERSQAAMAAKTGSETADSFSMMEAEANHEIHSSFMQYVLYQMHHWLSHHYAMVGLIIVVVLLILMLLCVCCCRCCGRRTTRKRNENYDKVVFDTDEDSIFVDDL